MKGFPGWQFPAIPYAAGMELFKRILKIAVEGGASDTHIKIGAPVIFRINRELVAVECPQPTADWMNKICLLYTSPSPRDRTRSRMPSSA